MGQVLGADGKPADREVRKYQIGEFGLNTPNLAGDYLVMALQKAGIYAKNPFQESPATQGVFMLVATELEAMRKRIEELEAKLASGEEDSDASDS